MYEFVRLRTCLGRFEWSCNLCCFSHLSSIEFVPSGHLGRCGSQTNQFGAATYGYREHTLLIPWRTRWLWLRKVRGTAHLLRPRTPKRKNHQFRYEILVKLCKRFTSGFLICTIYPELHQTISWLNNHTLGAQHPNGPIYYRRATR